MMNDEYVRIWKEEVKVYSKVLSQHSPSETKKTWNVLVRIAITPGRDLNRGTHHKFMSFTATKACSFRLFKGVWEWDGMEQLS
jgi:hypothetical protein